MQLNVTSIQLNDPISELDNSRFASKFKSSLSLSKTNTTIYSILSFSLTCLACSCLWLCIPLSPYFFYYWWSRLSFFLSFFYLFILNFSLFMLSIYPFFLSIYPSFLSIPFFLYLLLSFSSGFSLPRWNVSFNSQPDLVSARLWMHSVQKFQKPVLIITTVCSMRVQLLYYLCSKDWFD